MHIELSILLASKHPAPARPRGQIQSMSADVSSAADHWLHVPKGAKLFRLWLLVLIVLVLVMVSVGGATRLTGSGLSITEWKPITGAIPPLNPADWATEFALYRSSPQYRLLNEGMSLSQFQFIYWWEWGHRQLGRFIGLVMLAGFIGFWATGVIRGRMALLTFGLGLLLGLQGTIGWIMVASGLQPGMVAVAPVKLTLHLVFACLYFTALVAMTTHLGRQDIKSSDVAIASRAPEGRASEYCATKDRLPTRGIRLAAWGMVIAVLVQIALGGLVAGSKAGLTYNTWPLMDGVLIPDAAKLFVLPAFWENFVDNITLVQFNHRLVAYILLMLALWHWLAARGTHAGWGAKHLVYAVLTQGAFGILTLLLVVPLWAGLLHQLLAMLVLVSAVRHAVKSG